MKRDARSCRCHAPQVHREERDVAHGVDPAQVGVELDAVERRQRRRRSAQVVEVQVAVALAHEPSGQTLGQPLHGVERCASNQRSRSPIAAASAGVGQPRARRHVAGNGLRRAGRRRHCAACARGASAPAARMIEVGGTQRPAARAPGERRRPRTGASHRVLDARRRRPRAARGVARIGTTSRYSCGAKRRFSRSSSSQNGGAAPAC